MKNPGTRFPGGGNAAANATASASASAKKDDAAAVETQPDGHVEGAGKDEMNVARNAEDAMKNLDIKANGST